MVCWEVLDADCDEETRQAYDVGSLTSLYEVVKLAYLQPNDKFVGHPHVYANAAWGKVALVLDSTVFVFGEGCASLLMQLSLDAFIDLVVWVPQGNFLILGDCHGEVHCAHIDSQQVLITKKLPLQAKDNRLFVGGDSKQMENGMVCITMVTCFGHVIRMENIDPEGLIESLRLGDKEQLMSLEAQMMLSMDNIDLKGSQMITAGCVVDGEGFTSVMCGGEEGLTIWVPSSLHDPSESLTWRLPCQLQCLRVIPICEGRYIVMLDTSGRLTVLCGMSGLMVWEGADDSAILDVSLLQGDSCTTQLLLLQKNSDNGGCLLRIVAVPGFSVVYELHVSESTKLVRTGEGAESILFLEPDIDLETQATANLKLKSIVDGIPEARLAKLLRKRKFIEAEEFCQRFNLDEEEVKKARAKYLSDLMNPWTSSTVNVTHNEHEGAADLIGELLNTLGKIRDAEFVTELCVEVPMPDLAITKKVLNYAKERLANTTKSEEGDHLSSLMQRVSESAYRLRTFETIFPSSDIQHWLAFSHTDMLEEFIEHLSKGNLDVASTVWHRHLYEFEQQVDEDCVKEILDAFPHKVQSAVLCNWLPRNVLSDLVKLCPSSMEIIASWGDRRVKSLEILEKNSWPSNGLQLANTIISVLENVAADFQSGGNIEVQMAVHVAQWKAHLPSSALYHLRQTAHALKDLELLANKFRIKIEFNQYAQVDKAAVVAALLDWLICGEEVAPLMEGFLHSYFIRHGLDYDRTLASYVLNTLASADQDWWAWQEAPWEDKLYAVIRVISDAQVRAQCIVECINVAPVPWSEGTKDMCELGLSLNTPLSIQLEDQRRLVGLKLVLRRYSLHLINIADSRNAEMILQNILSQEGENVIEDAMQVVSTYKHLSKADAYYLRATHLLTTGNADSVKSLLQSIDDNLQRLTCLKLVAYTKQRLMSSPKGQKCRELQKSVIGVVLSLESLFKKWCHLDGMVCEGDFFSTLRTIYTLQERYDIYPTLWALESYNHCKSLFTQHVSEWYTNHMANNEEQVLPAAAGIDKTSADQNVSCSQSHPEDRRTSWKGLHHLQRLATLLGISRGELFSLLATLATRNGRLDEAVSLCQLIVSDAAGSDCTQVIYEVINLVLENQKQQQSNEQAHSSTQLNATVLQERNECLKTRADLIDVIHNILCSVLFSVHRDLLDPLLELSQWFHVGQTLYAQCHVEGVYTQAEIMESSNPYTSWKFSPIFQDSSMPIEDSLVKHMMTDAIDACFSKHFLRSENIFIPYQNHTEEPNSFKNERVPDATLNMMSHLRERGQDLLALCLSLLLAQQHVISESQSVCAQGFPDWQQIFTLLLKVLSNKRPDGALAVNLLTLLTKKDALRVLNELIKRFGYDYARLQSVALVGRDYCTLSNLKEVCQQFNILLKRALWGKRFAEFNVSFKEAFKSDAAALKKVLADLVAHPDCSFSVIYEYCSDFNLEVTDALLCYLRTTLQSWSPEMPEEEIRVGAPLLIDPPRALLLKCQNIIAEIDDKASLLQMLSVELKQLSSYNYELLELMLQQLLNLQDDAEEIEILKRGLDIVNFLRVYTRCTPPGDVEVDDWISLYPQSLHPPEISKYRLPFHELFKRSKSMMKIIEAELNIDTVDIWLRAAQTLKLNSDQLCMLATQNTVSSALDKEANTISGTKSTSEIGSKNICWQVCSTNSALLARVRTVVNKMQNTELATACANWVVNRLPPGVDKVVAAEKCKALAQQWKSNQPEPKAEDAYTRMCGRHQQLALEHALHKYNLAEPQYLPLTRTPVDLIFVLYKHPSLDSLATLGTNAMPDINSCVSEICAVVGCSQVSIQLDLLEKWLPPPESGEGIGTEETITNFQIALDPGAPTQEDPSDDASLSRVIYLLRCCPQDEAVSYLLNRALSEDASVSAAHRLRALRCLLAIADEQKIQKHCGKEVTSIRCFLQTITYVSRLESLGHATSVQQFNSMDKSALVEGLWRSQRHNPQALTLLTDLCHDYKVTTASLWGAVLTQLTNFVKSGQIEVGVLERILLQVKSLPHLWVVPALTTAWTTLINYPFTKASCPISEKDLTSCVHSIDLLLRHCPVIVSTAPLVRHCKNLNLPTLALAIAAADQVESHNLQAMVECVSPTQMKSQYKKLKSTFAFPRNVEDILEILE